MGVDRARGGEWERERAGENPWWGLRKPRSSSASRLWLPRGCLSIYFPLSGTHPLLLPPRNNQWSAINSSIWHTLTPFCSFSLILSLSLFSLPSSLFLSLPPFLILFLSVIRRLFLSSYLSLARSLDKPPLSSTTERFDHLTRRCRASEDSSRRLSLLVPGSARLSRGLLPRTVGLRRSSWYAARRRAPLECTPRCCPWKRAPAPSERWCPSIACAFTSRGAPYSVSVSIPYYKLARGMREYPVFSPGYSIFDPNPHPNLTWTWWVIATVSRLKA